MENRFRLAGWCGAVLVALALPAGASEIDVQTGEPLQVQRAAIEQELATGDRYAEIEPDQLERTRVLLQRMETILGVDGHADSLSPDRRTELFNLQEEVNTILTAAAEDSRLVCRRERPIGSNRPVNVCHTVAERRAMREDGKDMLRRRKTWFPKEGAR